MRRLDDARELGGAGRQILSLKPSIIAATPRRGRRAITMVAHRRDFMSGAGAVGDLPLTTSTWGGALLGRTGPLERGAGDRRPTCARVRSLKGYHLLSTERSRRPAHTARPATNEARARSTRPRRLFRGPNSAEHYLMRRAPRRARPTQSYHHNKVAQKTSLTW